MTQENAMTCPKAGVAEGHQGGASRRGGSSRTGRTKTFLAALAIGLLPTGAAEAAPPTASDDIDYAASGFLLPEGAVVPAAFSGPLAGGPAAHDPRYGGIAPIPSQMPSGFPSMPGPPGAAMPSSPGAAMHSPRSASMAGPAGMPAGGVPNTGMPTEGFGSRPFVQPGYGPSPYGVAPVGYHPGMFSGTRCDTMPSGYDGCCSAGSCDGSCGGSSGGCHFEGILPALLGSGDACGNGQCSPYGQCGSCGSGNCASGMLCNGCLGSGGVLGSMCDGSYAHSDMGLLASYIGGGLAGLADALRPYTEGGRCAQRWYDVSLEALFLAPSLSSLDSDFVVTNRGVSGTPGVADDPALTLGDVGSSDLEAGVRLSLAMIFGPGGNLETTYMGGHDWGGTASATRDGDPLTSFASGYGAQPPGGFANTSDFQSVSTTANFHSVELNYRRRTVGPYCKFQGSWLVGMRYLRFDNSFNYSTFGPGGTIEFFNQSFDVDNNLFGGQAGFDFWWNVAPGLHLGTEMKGFWAQNDWDRRNAIGTDILGITNFADGGQDGTLMGELTVTALYRFAYSWTFRSSYHLMGIDDIVSPAVSQDYITDFLDPGINTGAPPLRQSSLTLQGFSVGLEYLW